jgi:hypothetical protein
METQREQAPGETFRRGVSRALEALDKLSFIPKDLKETITSNAAKLCLAEAIAEQKASELSQRAVKEWEAQAPQIKASLERLLTEIPEQVTTELEKLKKAFFDARGQKTPDATAAQAADSPQTPPSADGKPEA